MLIRFDPTFCGLLSAVAYCLRRRISPEGMLSLQDPPSLLESCYIPEEPDIESLFERHLGSLAGVATASQVMETSCLAWCSEQMGIGLAIRHFLAETIRLRQDPSDRLFDHPVAEVVQAARKVGSQAHHYLGLLRFREIYKDFFAADFRPDYQVLSLVFPHFCQRLADQNFVIRDQRRLQAAIHLRDGRTGYLQLAEKAEQEHPESSLGQIDAFAAMWQHYLEHLTIPERINPALQRSNMPKKYWSFLVEDPEKQSRQKKRDSR